MLLNNATKARPSKAAEASHRCIDDIGHPAAAPPRHPRPKCKVRMPRRGIGRWADGDIPVDRGASKRTTGVVAGRGAEVDSSILHDGRALRLGAAGHFEVRPSELLNIEGNTAIPPRKRRIPGVHICRELGLDRDATGFRYRCGSLGNLISLGVH